MLCMLQQPETGNEAGDSKVGSISCFRGDMQFIDVLVNTILSVLFFVE